MTLTERDFIDIVQKSTELRIQMMKGKSKMSMKSSDILKHDRLSSLESKIRRFLELRKHTFELRTNDEKQTHYDLFKKEFDEICKTK